MDEEKKDEFEDLDFDLDEDFDLDDESIDDLDDDILDDVADLDDLEDADWSDIVVEDEENVGSGQASHASVKSSASAAPKSNKFLVFGLIGLFALVVLFVVGSKVLSLFSSDDAPIAVASKSEEESLVQEEVLEEAPPMPVAVSNEEDGQLMPVEVLPSVEDADSALTPLPSFEDVEAAMPAELPPLGLENEDMDVESQPSPSVVQEESVEEEIIANEVMDQGVDIVPVAQIEKSQASFVDEKRIEALEGRLAGTEESLDRIMEVLDRLEMNLNKVSGDVDKAMALAKSKKVETKTSSPAPAKKKTVAKSVAKPAAKKPVLYDAAPKKVASEPVGSWSLKSAQPGRAVVAESTTNYLRSVEVGSTLPGIGKITSISQVNGRWVVQGTQGRISQ